MENNYTANCRVGDFKFNEGIKEQHPTIDNETSLTQEQISEIENAINNSNDIGEVREALQQINAEYLLVTQGETTKIFLQDKELSQIRAINFEIKDEVERSEEFIPELSEEERREIAKRIQEKKITKEEIKAQYGEKIEEREIDEEIDRNTLGFNDEVRMNQMLFEASDIYAVNDVLEIFGFERAREDRPYIIEYQSGFESGMKIVFGQEARVINEIASEEEKQALLACNDMGEVDRVIKYTDIDRQDKRDMEMTNDEDERRNREGIEYSATGRNGWEYEGLDR